jgi:hypothetical protein
LVHDVLNDRRVLSHECWLGAFHLAGGGGNRIQRVPGGSDSLIGNLPSLAWLEVVPLV